MCVLYQIYSELQFVLCTKPWTQHCLLCSLKMAQIVVAVAKYTCEVDFWISRLFWWVTADVVLDELAASATQNLLHLHEDCSQHTHTHISTQSSIYIRPEQLGMGIDKILLIPMPLSILLISPTPFPDWFLINFLRKKGGLPRFWT